MIGPKILALLEENGWSQADFADMLGVKQPSVSQWIKGKHVPSAKKLRQISSIFRIQVRWFKNDRATHPPGEEYLLPGSADKATEANEPIVKVPPFEKIGKDIIRINSSEMKTLLDKLEDISGDTNQGDVADYLDNLVNY